jgi:hypothetical protein
LLEAARRDPAQAVFVFERLLKRDPDNLAKLLLGHANLHLPFPDPGSNSPMDIEQTPSRAPRQHVDDAEHQGRAYDDHQGWQDECHQRQGQKDRKPRRAFFEAG